MCGVCVWIGVLGFTPPQSESRKKIKDCVCFCVGERESVLAVAGWLAIQPSH